MFQVRLELQSFRGLRPLAPHLDPASGPQTPCLWEFHFLEKEPPHFQTSRASGGFAPWPPTWTPLAAPRPPAFGSSTSLKKNPPTFRPAYGLDVHTRPLASPFSSLLLDIYYIYISWPNMHISFSYQLLDS